MDLIIKSGQKDTEASIHLTTLPEKLCFDIGPIIHHPRTVLCANGPLLASFTTLLV